MFLRVLYDNCLRYMECTIVENWIDMGIVQEIVAP